MLRELLRSIGDGRLVRHEDIARSLGVSPHLLGQMLDDLARGGYLRPITSTCSSPCASCPIAAACSPGVSRLWMLTERGRAMVGTAPHGAVPA